MSPTHEYLSTACWHELNDGRPALHAQCRATCKTCDQPCSCPNHPAQDKVPEPLPWVDQARGIAARLLAALEAVEANCTERHDQPDVLEEIRTDPRLFWLRGEVQPPGEWRPGGSDPK